MCISPLLVFPGGLPDHLSIAANAGTGRSHLNHGSAHRTVRDNKTLSRHDVAQTVHAEIEIAVSGGNTHRSQCLRSGQRAASDSHALRDVRPTELMSGPSRN